MSNSRWSARLPLATGFLTLCILSGTVYLWGVQAQITGAIVASGRVDVETNRQVIQHPNGGVVGEILARDGDVVTAGQILLRLDGTFLQSELAIIESQLFDIWARTARLEAERDNADALVLPPELGTQAGRKIFEGQQRLFDARAESDAAVRLQIQEQARLLEDQIVGMEAELIALTRQLDLINQELGDSEALLEKGLIQASRVLSLQRKQAQLQGNLGRQSAGVAQLRGQIASLETEKLRLTTTARQEAITTLRDLNFREAELSERHLSLIERLNRLDVRAPVDGVVFGSTIFALQSVIQPAATVMSIIPTNQPMIVKARIQSIDVDQVHMGQQATLRFAAFDQRTTPEIFGRLTHLSASALKDEVTGESYYQVDLLPDAEGLQKLGNQVLVPGMPVDAFIRTGERSPLNYLTKPLTDYFTKAFREG